MFEMTYTTTDGRRVRGGMAFDSPSHARHGVYVTPNGSAITRKDFDQMKRKRLVFDDLASPTASGPKKAFNPVESQARSRLDDAIKQVCDALGLEHAKFSDQVHDILDEHERQAASEHAAALGAPQQGKGKGARDDDVIDDDLRKRIEEAVKQALAGMRGGETEDEIPNNHLGGGPPIKNRISDEDLEREFPGIGHTTRDVYGAPTSEQYDPVRRLGERAAERLPGGGVSRRLSNDSADLAFDAELTQLIAAVKVGPFG
jgi:hypothetical protein